MMREANLIKKIGISIYGNDEFEIAINNKNIDVIQLPFNLLDNWSQRGEIINKAKINNKEIQVRSVFLQGLFFKSIKNIPIKLKTLYPYLSKIREISKEYNITLEQLALQYCLLQPGIDHIIMGVDNIKQLKNNLNICDASIPLEAIQKINSIHVKDVNLLYPKNW